MRLRPEDIAPLPPEDARGQALRVGDPVRIPRMPAWLLRDLPEDERNALLALTGTAPVVRGFDAFGYAWFGEEGPCFCVRPDETLRDIGVESLAP